MRYDWVKIWVEDWLEGSIRKEGIDIRGILVGLIAYAGKTGDGRIKLAEGVGLTDEQLSVVLNVPLEAWEKAKKRLKKEEIEVEKGNIIRLKKWKKYQHISEYKRQKPYRDKKRGEKGVVTQVTDKVTDEVTKKGYKQGYKEGYTTEEKRGDREEKREDVEEKRKEKKEKDSNVKILIDYYFKKFFSIYNKKPAISGGKEGQLLKQLLTNNTLTELQELIDLFLEGETGDDFIEQSGKSLSVFCGSTIFNKLLLLKNKEDKREKEVKEWQEKKKRIEEQTR